MILIGRGLDLGEGNREKAIGKSGERGNAGNPRGRPEGPRRTGRPKAKPKPNDLEEECRRSEGAPWSGANETPTCAVLRVRKPEAAEAEAKALSRKAVRRP